MHHNINKNWLAMINNSNKTILKVMKKIR